MAVHELQFYNLLRLKNGSAVIRWGDTNPKANEKMQFRIALGRLKKAIDEESRKKPLPIYPYADKEGRVAALAKQIKNAKKTLDEQLFALISTCTPVQYQNSAMAEASVGYQFVFDDSAIWRQSPKILTPGELLSLSPVKDRGMELIPVSRTSELYALCISVLREWGLEAYFSYINEYAFRGDIKTSTTAISAIHQNEGVYDFWITAPNIGKLKDRVISGVRIMDDVSFLSYLYLMAAEDAGMIIEGITASAIAKILEGLGRGETAKDILRGVPFPTPVGSSAAIKMQGLLDREMGESILGKDAYEQLVERFDAWATENCEEAKKMGGLLTDIENALAAAFELDLNNLQIRHTLPSILIILTPTQQTALLEGMERRGYDLPGMI